MRVQLDRDRACFAADAAMQRDGRGEVLRSFVELTVVGVVHALAETTLGLDDGVAAADCHDKRIVDALAAGGVVAALVEADDAQESDASPLRRRVRQRVEPVDRLLELGRRPDLGDRLGAVEEQVERHVGAAARELDRRCANVRLACLAAAPELPGLARGHRQVRRRSRVVAGAQPVMREPCRARAALREMRGDAGV